jgi:beta-aspartyl-peptidase (threonine type)
MLLIASANGALGMDAGMEILRGGGSALDAVEAATKLVELNPDDHSVGVGGHPNLLGVVELDASIMEGEYRRAGAVAAVKGFAHPISIARRILEKLPQHLLLAGEGAEMFALEHGFTKTELLNDETRNIYNERVGRFLKSDTPLTPLASLASDPKKTAGTVNFIARDKNGLIATAVSTSGWAYKYPGRVGDSPVIGAGNYCDNRYGACACTGLGEWSIRSGLARMTVAGLKYGLSLDNACRSALDDLYDVPLPENIIPEMSLVAIDASENHIAFSANPDHFYVWQTGDMFSFEKSTRIRYYKPMLS